MGVKTGWLRRFLVLTVVCLSITASAYQGLVSTEQGRALVFEALVQVFEEHYWDPDYRDWESWAARYRQAALAADGREAFDSIARSMVFALNDGHSSYLGLAPVEEFALESVSAEPGLGFRHSFLSGVGLVVERVYAQTPAAQAGLQRGDVVVRLNGQDLRGLEPGYRVSGRVDRLLREAIASGVVRLGVRRESDYLTLKLTPVAFSLDYVRNLPQSSMLDEHTGYLYIPTFNLPFIADEVHRQLRDLQERGAQALVLDLRGNLGGRLGELGLVLGAFVEGPWAKAVSHGDVVWQGRYYTEEGLGYNVLSSPDEVLMARDVLERPTHFEGPVTVLVSRENSSAGEVAALVLQDLERATVIGEPTEGNVEAVRAFELPDGGLVLVAVANLQGISGRPFDEGVMPDVLARARLKELARGFDAPLAEALRVLKELPFTPGKFF